MRTAMTKRKRSPEWHVLDFFCDDSSSCALTIYSNHSRFHVIADASKLNTKSTLCAEYWELVRRLQEDGGDSVEEQKSHGSDDQDSGVDISGDGTATPTKQDPYVHADVEAALQCWMLAPLLRDNLLLKPTRGLSTERSLQQWYHCPTHFFELTLSDNGDRIDAIELEAIPELKKEVEKLLPSVLLSKYILNSVDVPLSYANDFEVLECSDQPPGTPYHPCRVRHRQSKETYFLKVVDNSQPHTTKRELDVLGRITRLKLSKQIHVPVLEGIVSYDDTPPTASGRRKIMGFLQSEITNPTPLTNLLDPTISQPKREKWAKEVERINDILHEHKIVWGDAKADNFLVDEKDNIWIIDFGGSYTEGWIDPEFKETEEGDDMGVEKTINALQDPEANTYDPDNEEEQCSVKEQTYKTGQKRKANSAQPDVENIGSKKRQRSSAAKG